MGNYHAPFWRAVEGVTPSLTLIPLVEQPRSQPAQVIAPRGETTLLDWLESSGRMMPRAADSEPEYLLVSEDPEISGLIDSDNVADDFELGGDDEELGLDD